MTKKYFQAKKLTNNPFAIGSGRPKSQKNKFVVLFLLGLFGIIGISMGVSYLHSFFKKGDEKKTEKSVRVQESHKKRVIKPLSDEDFKGAKEYNFYTQLEERSLVMANEDRFGGMVVDSINGLNVTPGFQLESIAQNVMPKVLEQKPENKVSVVKNDIVMAPLVLESAVQSTKPQVKPDNLPKTINLQIGSFVSHNEAASHKAKLEKSGFSPRVIQGKNATQQTVYRVHIGPFSTQESKAVKERLNALKVGYFEVK